VKALLKMDKYIDIIIPRGGNDLIRFVVDNSTIPVIKHDKGVCHVYVDKAAGFDMAERIIFNAKVQRPGVCNATETLLVHKDVAEKFLPRAAVKLREAKVELRGCERSCAIVKDMKPATEADWYEEYLDLILAVKVVDSSNPDAILGEVDQKPVEFRVEKGRYVLSKPFDVSSEFLSAKKRQLEKDPQFIKLFEGLARSAERA